nr:unnamed protein product [Digitaria exilis]
MDQHGEKEPAENKSQDSAEQQREDDDDDAAAEEKVTVDTYKAAEEESAPLIIKEVTAAGSEESSSPAAHPCSLLQLLLRACAGCLGLQHGDDPKPAAAEDSSQEGENDGDKANYLYMQGEVITRVFAVRRPTPPGDRPREGDGGNGGVHH